MSTVAIVVSGLPGSGKSTIGKVVASELRIPLIDKDDFLETLFEVKGIRDQRWRRQLSIEADRSFKAEALRQKRAVLVSHWKPQNMINTGTPTDWLENHFSRIVEIYCHCNADIAADRFMTRKRHPGHLEHEKSRDEVRDWMKRLAPSYPLGIGRVVKTSTEAGTESHSVISQISRLIEM